MHRRVATAIVLAALVSGCSEDEETSTVEPVPSDCTADEVFVNKVGCIRAGVPPGACGDGFVSDERGGCVAELPDQPCAPGTYALTGETECHEVAPCGDGTWGSIPIEPNTVFVDQAFTGTGDGSMQAPYNTIRLGLVNSGGGGTIVAVAAGSYVEDVVIGPTVRLWGRCPSMVEIVGVSENAALEIDRGSHGTEIRDLSVTGPNQGITVLSARPVTLERVWVHDTGGVAVEFADTVGETEGFVRGVLIENSAEGGIFAYGSALTVENSVVRDIVAGGRGLSFGIQALNDSATGRRAFAYVAHSKLERLVDSGLNSGGSAMSVVSTLVRDVGAAGMLQFGRCASAELVSEPATLDIRASVLEGCREVGIASVGSALHVEGVSIRDVTPAPLDNRFGRCISTEHSMGVDASAVIRSSLAENCYDVGISFSDTPNAEISQTIVRDILPEAAFHVRGRGINIQQQFSSASAALNAVVVSRTHTQGLAVFDATVTMDGSAIEATAKQPDGQFGDGIATVALNLDASVAINKSWVVGSARAGASTFGSHMAVGSTVLACNGIQLDGESFNGRGISFENLGGNDCRCGDSSGDCKLESHELAAPVRIDP